MKYVCVILCAFHAALTCGSDTNMNKQLIELSPRIITTKIGELIKFPTERPINRGHVYSYIIIKPNGDTIDFHNQPYNNNNALEDTRSQEKTIIVPNTSDSKYNYFNNKSVLDVVQTYGSDEQFNILIGPIADVDHGNWIVSLEIKDADGTLYEIFRVVSVEVIEKRILVPEKIHLHIGDTYTLRFNGNVPHLVSCELVAPETAFDRYYERDLRYRHCCGYIVRNLTMEDIGTWKIVAVGRIVYVGEAILNVLTNINI